MSINRVTISGNLTRDSELRSTQGGMSVLTFGVAVNDRRKNPQTGEWEDYPNFVDCVLFGKRADTMAGILLKGVKVMVDGKLRYSSWERDGQRRSKLEVVADDVDLPPKGTRGQQAQQGYGQQPVYAAPAPQPAYSATAQPAQAYPAPAPHPQQQQLSGMPQQQAPTMDMYEQDIPF